MSCAGELRPQRAEEGGHGQASHLVAVGLVIFPLDPAVGRIGEVLGILLRLSLRHDMRLRGALLRALPLALRAAAAAK